MCQQVKSFFFNFFLFFLMVRKKLQFYPFSKNLTFGLFTLFKTRFSIYYKVERYFFIMKMLLANFQFVADGCDLTSFELFLGNVLEIKNRWLSLSKPCKL